jgi:hypothetical protein
MLARIANTLTAAIVAASTILTLAATVQARPLSAPTQAEKMWMDRATGSVDKT